MPRADPAEQVDLPGRVGAEHRSWCGRCRRRRCGRRRPTRRPSAPARRAPGPAPSRAWVSRAAATARSRLPALASSISRVSRGSSNCSHQRARSAGVAACGRRRAVIGFGDRQRAGFRRAIIGTDRRAAEVARARTQKGAANFMLPPLLHARCRASLFGRADFVSNCPDRVSRRCASARPCSRASGSTGSGWSATPSSPVLAALRLRRIVDLRRCRAPSSGSAR